jgi:TatD DNase family protein
MIFDIHAHYNDDKYNDDRDQVFARLPKEDVKYVINTADNVESSILSIDYSEKYDFIFATCGVHPQNVLNLKDEDITKLRDLSSHPKVVAIGEIGLDYYYDSSNKDQQKYWFSRQVDLASETGLPIVIHDRDAHEDTMKEIKRAHSLGVNGVLHCYSGSVEMAKEVINFGFHLSVGGVVTFKNAKKLIEVIKWIPIEYLLLETDCPYMAPEPFRGKRNDSSLIRYVAEKIAEIKGLSYDQVLRITTGNACRLFFGRNCDIL